MTHVAFTHVALTHVAFVVNGGPSSPMDQRAQAFAARLRERFDIRVFHRSKAKVWSMVRLVADLLRSQPRVCYVLDMGYSGVGAGLLYKCLTGNRLVIDTGDAITALARSLGRGPVGIALTRCLEEVSVRAADRLVVRGSVHKERLRQQGVDAEFIPDGVAFEPAAPHEIEALRRQLGLDDVLTIGLVGTSVWSPRLGICYGWDLVETIRLLADQPVRGVMIGDGDGIAVLQARCADYGIVDRVLFLGRVPLDDLPRYLGVMDVCLSTQTNDLAGQVRTTGKLPLYLAAGRFVLASRVGEAARVLDDAMLVDYDGQMDANYPHKLAGRIRHILTDPALLERGRHNMHVARTHFDYKVLTPRVARVIADSYTAGGRRRPSPPASRSAPARAGERLRLAVLCDYEEEGWPSMDLVAAMFLQQVRERHRDRFEAAEVCPPFRERAGRLPWLGQYPSAHNVDRLVNRFWDYPRWLRQLRDRFDLFHLTDHSYAQLVHELPAERTGVLCHDLDTFRCLLEPERERRPRWFRELARRTLRGLQKAAVVFYLTTAVREAILRFGLVDPGRLVHAPNGVCPEFTPAPPADEPACPTPRDWQGRPFVLHVGSAMPRKRIDVLLEVFANLRRRHPELKLLQVGGTWTPPQQMQLRRLRITDAVSQRCGLSRRELAVCYRRAALVVQPSDAEGFGLPVLEALACGALVVASDIPPLREVGGDAAVYCPVGDVSAWTAATHRLLADATAGPTRDARLHQAARFSWAAQAQTILGAYMRLLPPLAEAKTR
ncbi:MAG: glycosyltransferase [Gemmataceae bacterium]|nr:glycosyltransferase [Gemmataceae bacterium]